MSKKNKQNTANVSGSSPSESYAGEYKVIKHDLIRVLLLNALYLALVVVVYVTNNQSHYLQKWFGGIANI